MVSAKRRRIRGFGLVSARERRNADAFLVDLMGLRRARGQGRARGEPGLGEGGTAEAAGCAPPGPVPVRCMGLRRPEVLDCFDHEDRHHRGDVVLPRHQPQIMNLAHCIVASHLTSSPITRLQLVGHTDDTGPSSYNGPLGQRRADAVKTALQAALTTLTGGRPPTVTMTTSSAGESRPLARGDHAPSRRVEVFPPAAMARPPSLPVCACDLGIDGEALRARLATTLEQALATTTPHESRPVIGQTGPSGLFTGNFDYHSAVHGQWARLSLARTTGDAPRRTTSLAQLSEANLTAERTFLQQPTNTSFELPYGRAWLVLLLSEVAANPGRNTATLQALRRTAEQELLTWLEANRATANNAAVGRHGSWLFALLLLQMSTPILPGAAARITALYTGTVATHRATWRARASATGDFLHVPSIIDTLDLLRGQPAQRTVSNMPASRIATISAGHDVGEEMTRLWPVAILSRTQPAMCTELKTRLREWLLHPEHWEFGPTTPTTTWSARFHDNSHWTPQFLWMAIKLRC